MPWTIYIGPLLSTTYASNCSRRDTLPRFASHPSPNSTNCRHKQPAPGKSQPASQPERIPQLVLVVEASCWASQNFQKVVKLCCYSPLLKWKWWCHQGSGEFQGKVQATFFPFLRMWRSESWLNHVLACTVLTLSYSKSLIQIPDSNSMDPKGGTC